jgi:DNA topoisomerase-3
MTTQEREVYAAIVKYYALQFLPPAEYDTKTLVAELPGGGTLTKEAKRLTSSGWLVYAGEADSERNTAKDNSEFFVLKDCTYETEIVSATYKERKTSAPERYTYASLLADMSNIVKYVKDPEIKRLLKEKDADKPDEHGSIGTPATRAGIIEKLIDEKCGYLKITGNKLISTEKGRAFFGALREDVKSIDITAKWYMIQRQISSGEATIEDLAESILEQVKSVIADPSSQKVFWKKDQEPVGKCPYCGGNVYKNSMAYTCEFTKNKECTFFIMIKNKWFQTRGKGEIKTKVMQALLTPPHKAVVRNFKKKDGSGGYDAVVTMEIPAGKEGFPRFEMSFDKDLIGSQAAGAKSTKKPKKKKW